MIKIIDNITPFNNFYYRSCYYSSLFPVICHFNRDIIAVIANDTINYGMVERKNGLFVGIEFSSFASLKDVLSEIGIAMEEATFDNENDIIQAINESIFHGDPVILWVDCYYLPVRKDAYLRFHNPHTILIYGVDLVKNIYYVIEHRELESLTYEYKMLACSDLMKAYFGFLKYFQSQLKVYSFNSFKLIQNSDKIQEMLFIRKLTMNYLNKVKNNLNEFNEGINVLRNFSNYLQSIISAKDLLEEKVNDIMYSLNDIIRAKKAEHYKMHCLFGESQSQTQKNISDAWSEIRIPFARYNYSKRYRLDDFSDIENMINKIIQLEITSRNELLNLKYSELQP